MGKFFKNTSFWVWEISKNEKGNVKKESASNFDKVCIGHISKLNFRLGFYAHLVCANFDNVQKFHMSKTTWSKL